MVCGGLKQWGESTTVVGIPNIVRSNQWNVRVAWILFTAGMTVLLAFGSYQLIIGYMQYKVVETSVHESNPAKEQFPEVTVCPRQPFHDCVYIFFAYTQSGSRIYYEWMDLAKNHSLWTYFENCYKLKDRLYKLFKKKDYFSYDDIWSPTLYGVKIRQAVLDLLKINDPKKARDIQKLDNLQDYIATSGLSGFYLTKSDMYCHYRSASGRRKKCIIKTITHPKFVWCFSISVELEKDVRQTDSIEQLVLILKRKQRPRTTIFQNLIARWFRSRRIDDMSDQLSIHLHPQGHYPNLELNSISVSEGSLSSLKFKEIISTKLDTPRNPCYSGSYNVNHGKEKYSTYDDIVCKSSYFQKLIQERCKCRSMDYPDHENQYDENVTRSEDLPYCNAANWHDLKKMDTYKKKSNCAVTAATGASILIENSATQSGNKICLPVCQKNYYNYWISGHPKIPTVETKHSNVYYQEMLTSVIDGYLINNCTEKENSKSSICKFLKPRLLWNKPTGTFYVEAKPSVITIQRDNPGVEVKNERLIYTFTALLSELGGLASVTLEIAPVLLMEIIVVLLAKRNTEEEEEDEGN